jgi:hypothetical protein
VLETSKILSTRKMVELISCPGVRASNIMPDKKFGFQSLHTFLLERIPGDPAIDSEVCGSYPAG